MKCDKLFRLSRILQDNLDAVTEYSICIIRYKIIIIGWKTLQLDIQVKVCFLKSPNINMFRNVVTLALKALLKWFLVAFLPTIS